jgi:hypothetical protein
MKLKLKVALLFCAMFPLAAPTTAQVIDKDLLAQVTRLCAIREATTQIMVEGREKGILKEQVTSKLPPLTSSSSPEERATYARLNDVYGMPKVGVKTMSSHRFFSCLWQAMASDHLEPTFGSGLEPALLDCQKANANFEEHGRCVREAQRANVRSQ